MNVDSRTRLSEIEIQTLIARYASTKEVEYRDKIVLQFRGLVESISRRFAGSGEPHEDLAQEGFIGLISAADLYDVGKGVKFSTYATHFIIGQIKHALRDRGKIIKEPAWLQELNHRLTRVIDALSQELGRHPSETEIAKVMHVPEEMVNELLTTREVFKVSSLDVDPDDSGMYGSEIDNISDEKCSSFQLPVEDKVVLETAMNKLKILEQKVIQDFYYTGLTQTEIAKKLGISCNYVSHILRSGTKKLRRILTTDELSEIQMQLQLANRRTDTLGLFVDGSVVDPLTGLYNLEYIQNRLHEEVLRASREKSHASYVVAKFVGLDNFGAKYGTMRQDDFICSLGRAIKDSTRRCDIVGRVGTWEFSLILPYTGEGVSVVKDRIGESLLRVRDDFMGSRSSMDCELWIGLSVYPTLSLTAKGLIESADSDICPYERKIEDVEEKAA